MREKEQVKSESAPTQPWRRWDCKFFEELLSIQKTWDLIQKENGTSKIRKI